MTTKFGVFTKRFNWYFYTKSLSTFLLKNSRMCGKSFCENCITTSRRLAKDDENLYKICDACDDIVTNSWIDNEFKDILASKTSRIQNYKNKIEQVIEKTSELQQEYENLCKKEQEIENEYGITLDNEKTEQEKLEKLIESTKVGVKTVNESVQQNMKKSADYDKTLEHTREKYKKIEDRVKKREDGLKKLEEEFHGYEKQLESQNKIIKSDSS